MIDIEAEVAKLRACHAHHWTMCVSDPRLPPPVLPTIPEGESVANVWIAQRGRDDSELRIEPATFAGGLFTTLLLNIPPGVGGVLAWTYRYVSPIPSAPGGVFRAPVLPAETP